MRDRRSGGVTRLCRRLTKVPLHVTTSNSPFAGRVTLLGSFGTVGAHV